MAYLLRVFWLMRTYQELRDLAISCANSTRLTTSPEVASQLWRMAIDYQEKAAKLNNSKLPNIGDPPIMVASVCQVPVAHLDVRARCYNGRYKH
jgi:hypothetical protein